MKPLAEYATCSEAIPFVGVSIVSAEMKYSTWLDIMHWGNMMQNFISVKSIISQSFLSNSRVLVINLFVIKKFSSGFLHLFVYGEIDA